MSDISDKMKEFIKKYQMSVPQFAQGSRLHLQVAYNTINKKTKPREQTIRDIEQFMKKYSEEHNVKNIEKEHEEDISTIINNLKDKIYCQTGLRPNKIDIVISY